MAELTTTSFAILSLLAVRSWTTYELAQQMDRSVGRMWPRAESVVYEEPKRLEWLGLATAKKEYTGKRARTIYSITPEGRRELARWLAEPGGTPTVEFEALLKVAFADHGTLEGLRTNLAAIREYAERQDAYGEERGGEYAETGGPFPERLPVISLAFRYFHEQTQAILRWVAWAEDATGDWSGVTAETGARLPPDAFNPVARKERRGSPAKPRRGRTRAKRAS